MARARNIKPGFFRNADLAEIPLEARMLFIGLWTLADRLGRLEDRPKQIKIEIFPADNIDCERCLTELDAIGVIDRYEVAGKRVIQVCNFSRHQNPHRDEKASTLPDRAGDIDRTPCKHGASAVEPKCNQDKATMPIGLIPDSLIPESRILNPEEKKESDFALPGPPPSAPAPAPLPDLLGDENENAIPPRAIVKLGNAWELPERWGLDAEALGWQPDAIVKEAEKFRQHWVCGKGQGSRRGVKGWRQSWSNWLANAEKFQTGRRFA